METAQSWRGRAVLHVDMDAFFASVEQLDHPEWRGRPVMVGGDPGGRGVVAAASYEARAFGVRSAMPAARAARLCPDAVWARPRFGRYQELSRAAQAVLAEVTPHVEQVSIDEAYLDVTPTSASPDDPVAVAISIQRAIDALGLSCSIGIATSKTVAKIASDRDKPHGITVVRPGEEVAFLGPMPVTALPGIGAATAERLRGAGIHTLRELGSLDAVSARRLLGSGAAEFTGRARGIDERPVRAERPVKSVSNERTFASDVHDPAEADAALKELASRVAVRLRAKGLAGRTVTVKIRYGDFTTRTVRQTLPHPTDLEAVLLPAGRELLARVWTPGTGLRLMGLGVSGFTAPVDQLDLLSADDVECDERRRALARSLDAVRERFGDDVIGFGPHAVGEHDSAADDDGDR